MEHTEYYQLSLWEQDDRIQMEDFNADNQKIDAALAAKSRVACGVYTGDGTTTRTIPLSFTPKAVLVMPTSGLLVSSSGSAGTYVRGGICTTDSPLYAYQSQHHQLVLSCTTNGFIVKQETTDYSGYHYTGQTNGNNTCYHYIAIG